MPETEIVTVDWKTSLFAKLDVIKDSVHVIKTDVAILKFQMKILWGVAAVVVLWIAKDFYDAISKVQ